MSPAERERWRIVFAGANPDTLLLLASNPSIELVATGLYQAYFGKTLNPFNLLFQVTYLLRVLETWRWLEIVSCWAFRLFVPLTTGHWRRASTSLVQLVRNRTRVIDLNESKASAAYLRKSNVDILVVDVWDILSSEIIQATRLGALNVHPSPLPRHRGAIPTLWTLKCGDSCSAVTYILLGEQIDGGHIVSQHTFEVSEEDDWRSLEDKIKAIIHHTLIPTIIGLTNGTLPLQPQNGEAATWTGKYEAYRELDPSTETAKAILNKMHFYPFWDPGVFCYLQTGRWRFNLKRGRFGEQRKLTHDAPECWSIRGLRLLLHAIDADVVCRLFIDISLLDSSKLLARTVCPKNNGHRLARASARLGELTLGHTVNWLTAYGFDYILYPFAIWKLGLLYGSIVMAILSLIVCLLLIWFYDWSKRDWLGIEAVKEMKNYDGKSRFGRLLRWTLSRSDWLACAVLSVKFDSFITTAYLRHGAFNGMTRRDWRIFLLSWFIGNGYWTLACFGGVKLLSSLWRIVFHATP